MKRQCAATAWLAGAALLAGMMQRATGQISVVGVGDWAGKVSEYANPFDPDLNRDAAETSITYSPGWSPLNLARIVNRMDGRDSMNGGGRISQGGHSGSSGPAAFIQFDAPAEFSARTVIVSQNVWSGFGSTSMPYTLKVGSGASPAWASIAPTASGPGTSSYQSFQVINTRGSYDKMRIDYSQTAISGSTAYADFNSVIVLPDRLDRLPATATASHTSWGSAVSLVDSTNNSGWAYQGTAEPVTVTIDLGGTQRVDALVLYSYDNQHAVFTIEDDEGNPVANISMNLNPVGWALPVKFDEPLYTSQLVLDFGTATDVNFREIMVMQIIPEPTSLALLALGALGLLRRRRLECAA